MSLKSLYPDWSQLTAHKGILLRRSGMVCNLYPSPLLHGIVVKIDIRSLIKAVVRGFRCGRAEEVVNVSKATSN